VAIYDTTADEVNGAAMALAAAGVRSVYASTP